MGIIITTVNESKTKEMTKVIEKVFQAVAVAMVTFLAGIVTITGVMLIIDVFLWSIKWYLSLRGCVL